MGFPDDRRGGVWPGERPAKIIALRPWGPLSTPRPPRSDHCLPQLLSLKTLYTTVFATLSFPADGSRDTDGDLESACYMLFDMDGA